MPAELGTGNDGRNLKDRLALYVDDAALQRDGHGMSTIVRAEF